MNRVTSKDGTAIAFDRSGRGPTVILVGGAFQYRALDPKTAELAKLLAPHFTVFHYDRRGRGESGDTKPYAVQREIEDLDAMIKLAGGPAYVFGNSSGAMLGLEAAAAGLGIARLALYEPPFNSGDANARGMAAQYSRRLSELLAEGRRGDAVTHALTSWGTPPQAIDGMKMAPVWPLFEAVAPTLAYDDALMRDGAVPKSLLASVAVPTLVMDGGASPAFMREAARSTAAGLHHAQHRTLEGQTHDVDPGLLAPVLRDFFRG